MSEFDLKEFDFNEKGRVLAEEQNKIIQEVADCFISWVFDCQTEQGLMLRLKNLKGEYLKVFKKFTG